MRLEGALFEMLRDESPDFEAAARVAYARAVKRFLSPIGDRERLLGDRTLLGRVVSDSGGDLSANIVDRVLTHSRLQYSATAEEEFAHIPDSRKRAVDGRPLDAGTPTEDAGSIDVEDLRCFSSSGA